MKETYFEKILRINTSKSETRMDNARLYNRYEPTPYSALLTLFKHYQAKEDDHFVDFGSGKGRFSFFVNYYYNSGCTGVELVEEFHLKALANLENYGKKNPSAKNKLFFVNDYAEKYTVSSFENKFYFFNPFALNIFISTVNKIIESVEEHERIVDIILYYPSAEYINYLEKNTTFTHLMDIPLEISKDNYREKFVIYRFGDTFDILSEEYMKEYFIHPCK